MEDGIGLFWGTFRLREYIKQHWGGLRPPQTPLDPGPPAQGRVRTGYCGFRKDGPASSWPGPDGKCPKMASIPSSIALDKTLGVFGHAEFSARGPRPRFRAILMIFGGSKILEKSPGRANYSDALVRRSSAQNALPVSAKK